MPFYEISSENVKDSQGPEPAKAKPNKNVKDSEELEFAKAQPENWYPGERVVRNLASGLIKGAGAIASTPGQAVKLGESLISGAEQVRNRSVESALKKGGSALYGSDPEMTRKELNRLKDNPSQTPVLTPFIEEAEGNISKSVKSKLPEDFLKPRGQTEKSVQSVVQSIPMHFALGGGLNTLMSTLKSVGYGEASAQGVKSLGGGDIAQEVGRIAIPGLLYGRNVENVRKYFNPIKDKLYNEATQAAGNGQILVPRLNKNIGAFWKKEHSGAFKGGSNNKKNLALIANRVKGDKISLKDLVETKQQLNRLIYEERETPRYFEKILSDVNKGIESSKNAFPEFVNKLREADKVANVLNKTRQSESFLENVFKGVSKKDILSKIIFGPPSKTQLELFGKLPVSGFKYYAHAIKAATEGNKPLLIKQISNLEKTLSQLKDKSSTSGKSKYLEIE